MTKLIKYDAMCRAITEAFDVDEVKDIRDKAVAIELYSKLANNTENEDRAREIRLRAERKVGQLIKEMEKAKGGRPKTGDTVLPVSEPTLADRGITKRQSSDWQKLADVPDQEFEAALADPDTKPTTTGIINKSRPANVPSVDAPYKRAEREARAAQSPPPAPSSPSRITKVTEVARDVKRMTRNESVLVLCDFIINREWRA